MSSFYLKTLLYFIIGLLIYFLYLCLVSYIFQISWNFIINDDFTYKIFKLNELSFWNSFFIMSFLILTKKLISKI